MITLRQAAEDYLALRRSLGFRLKEPGRLLLDFTGYLSQAGESHVTVDLALAWARQPADAAPFWHWYRLTAVRGFAAYLNAFDPSHQVPPAGVLPRRYQRTAPYLFTSAEVASLMRAAGAMPPRLHAATYQALIGLLAVTGMRPGEAYALDRDHIDLHDATLTVVNGKYGKTRELTLQPGTIRALAGYARRRDLLCPRPVTPGFFVSLRGTRLTACNADKAFARLTRQAGLQPRSARSRPCLKNLRHTFAVTTLAGWYRTGADVGAHLPLLSTWLGHADPTSTYWYLQATPELLALAAGRLTHPAERVP